MDFMFVFFAALALAGALVVFMHPSIVHSAFGLVGALFGVAGLYWTIGADFLGALQLLLYVGGVTVLLLFAVMLTTRDTTRLSLFRYLLMAPVVGVAAVFVLKCYHGLLATFEASGRVAAEPRPTTEEIGQLFIDPQGYLVPFQVVAVLLLLVLIGAVTVARRQESAP